MLLSPCYPLALAAVPVPDRPMAKPRTVFVCSSCGADAPRWSGQCPSCGEWNTLAPFAEARARGSGRRESAGVARPAVIAQLVTEPETRMLLLDLLVEADAAVAREMGRCVEPTSMFGRSPRYSLMC